MTPQVPVWLAQLPTGLSETDFHTAWHAHVDPTSSPLEKALTGGYCADQPGWVFVAGYQGAIAYTFPDQQFSGWAAFAVSEDRAPESPRPGLVAQSVDGEQILYGYKTWIATSRHTQDLIVSYQAGEDTGFARFAVDCPGISLSHKEQPGMLPDVSQGVAGFTDVPLSAGVLLDASRAQAFGRIEGFFVLVALLACVHGRCDEAGVSEAQVTALLTQARQLGGNPESNPGTDAFKEQCRGLLRNIRQSPLGQQPLWERDGKLLAGYAR